MLAWTVITIGSQILSNVFVALLSIFKQITWLCTNIDYYSNSSLAKMANFSIFPNIENIIIFMVLSGTVVTTGSQILKILFVIQMSLFKHNVWVYPNNGFYSSSTSVNLAIFWDFATLKIEEFS